MAHGISLVRRLGPTPGVHWALFSPCNLGPRLCPGEVAPARRTHEEHSSDDKATRVLHSIYELRQGERRERPQAGRSLPMSWGTWRSWWPCTAKKFSLLLFSSTTPWESLNDIHREREILHSRKHNHMAVGSPDPTTAPLFFIIAVSWNGAFDQPDYRAFRTTRASELYRTTRLIL